MTYLEQAIVNLADLPQRIADFAALRGWTVAGRVLTRPGGGRSFEVGFTQGTNGYAQVWCRDFLINTRFARFSQPRRQGTLQNPIVLAPTKVHFFGSDAPFTAENPAYIAVVVEFGFNCFRHMFIGNIVKVGNYDGGELISANNWSEEYNVNSRNTSFTSAGVKNLFAAGHNHSTDNAQASGGLNANHPDNPAPWRIFDSSSPGTNNMLINLTGAEVFGGWSDQVNGVLAMRGFAPYAGGVVLVPINLYGSRANDGNNVRFFPFGYVPGVRLVRMDDIDPGQQIAIADQTWMVFPEMSKDSRASTQRDQGNGYYWDYETSGFLGLAYRMD